ncbi:hypothetical protein TSUD_176910 [Trifolium subterraneum]|uniref:Uncharacterized protein n=1 Tax=Trifolium subterraneum TaxID=3900 RepID=A0A2Z6MFV7_TRISU|nr:hypothetical protein TSUD_176910 [Trifolium subterraneum]
MEATTTVEGTELGGQQSAVKLQLWGRVLVEIVAMVEYRVVKWSWRVLDCVSVMMTVVVEHVAVVVVVDSVGERAKNDNDNGGCQLQ